MRRRAPPLLLPFCLAFSLTCDDGPRLDRHGNPCHEAFSTLRVEVVDAAGRPVRGATVTAIHKETGHTITSTTSERGVTTAVNETLGEGPVRVVATAGAQVSPAAEVTWTCDACQCLPEPATVRLQLTP